MDAKDQSNCCEEKSKEKREEEIKAKRLDRLKSSLSHLERQPYYDGHLDLSPDNLTRWLEASDNSALLAGARLRASVALRRRINLPALATGAYMPPHALSHHFGSGMCGVDRAGSPVYFLLFGLTDMEGIIQSCTTDEILTYWAFQFEVMLEKLKLQAKESTKKAHTVLLIVDMQGTNFRNFRWSVMCAWVSALQLYQELNPGLFKEILLINPPTTLPVMHKLVVSQMKHSVKERIKVIGAYDSLRHLLLRLEKHEIPAFLGGYKCDVDNNPFCMQDIVWPHRVPRWSYLSHPCLPADVINMAVQAGSVVKKELLVPVAGSRVTFKLYDVTHPVTLKVLSPAPPSTPRASKRRRGKPQPLYTARLAGAPSHQGGAVSCNRAGSYSLVLDNSKDLIHMVRAKVRVEILPPEKFLVRFAEKTPLGDSVDFYQPVTALERKKREELILACETCPAIALDSYY